jgi:hypothetical protein
MRDSLDRLAAADLIRFEGERTRTTKRWQAAMARAAFGLQRAGAPFKDLRLPVIATLVDRFPEATDDEIADLAETMIAVEEQELAPLWGGLPRPSEP